MVKEGVCLFKWRVRALGNLIFSGLLTGKIILKVFFGGTTSTQAVDWMYTIGLFIMIAVLMFKSFPDKWHWISALGGMLAGDLLIRLDILVLTIMGTLIFLVSAFLFAFTRKQLVDASDSAQQAAE